jgi:hypothetical protein
MKNKWRERRRKKTITKEKQYTPMNFGHIAPVIFVEQVYREETIEHTKTNAQGHIDMSSASK